MSAIHFFLNDGSLKQTVVFECACLTIQAATDCPSFQCMWFPDDGLDMQNNCCGPLRAKYWLYSSGLILHQSHQLQIYMICTCQWSLIGYSSSKCFSSLLAKIHPLLQYSIKFINLLIVNEPAVMKPPQSNWCSNLGTNFRIVGATQSRSSASAMCYVTLKQSSLRVALLSPATTLS